MKITIGFKNEHDPQGKLQEVNKIADLAEIVKTFNYSLATFKDNRRSLANFIQADAIALDFDENYNLEQAQADFAEYSHIIAPSRNHQKEKHGKVCDRFRVILILSSPISDAETFKATWHELQKRWPQTDPRCKDPSRFWFASPSVVSVKGGGKKVLPVQPEVKSKESKPTLNTPKKRGELSKATLQFLAFGVPAGGRNDATMRAAKDFQQNLYTVDEAIDQIIPALNFNGTIASDFTEYEAKTTIKSAYKTEAKHDPRIKEEPFRLQKIGELYKETENASIEWLVDELLQVGGVSLLSADPKAGKSVIARQLCAHVLTGTPFFGRATKRGVCYYYGIEEHPMVLARSFQRLGIEPEANLFVHAGDPLTDEGIFKGFADSILMNRPALAIIDTAFDLLEVESENNYREVKKAFKKVRKVARESGTHIMLIHHNGKPQKDFRQRGNHAVLGSTAISAGVDSILIVELDGRTRMISTSGREVNQWHQRTLVWDSKTKTYSLGPEREDY